MFENDNGKSSRETKGSIHLFIDCVKAFDRVKHQELIKVLEQIDIDEKTSQ